MKNKNKIRSFLAIELEKDIVPKIVDVQKEFKKTNTNIKYVSPENMHLTLKFFGNIDENMIENISNSIEKIIKNYSSFDLTIKNCGSFPNKNKIKIIWLGIDKNSPIRNLQKELDNEFEKLGFEKERNYISHLTIGRVKSPKNKTQIKDTITRLNNIHIDTMRVSKLSLKKSTLTPNGPIYEDLKTFKLE